MCRCSRCCRLRERGTAVYRVRLERDEQLHVGLCTYLSGNVVIVQDRDHQVGKVLPSILAENLNEVQKISLGLPVFVNKVDIDGNVGVPVAGGPKVERERNV